MTLQDIEKLKKSGKIQGYRLMSSKDGAKGKGGKFTGGMPKIEPVGLMAIKEVLRKKGLLFVTEHQFVKTRRFRFDVAVLNYRLAIEYEGLVATGQKGGHQTKAHYTSNCTKYNISALEGWTLLRYTARNYKDFEKDLVEFLMKWK